MPRAGAYPAGLSPILHAVTRDGRVARVRRRGPGHLQRRSGIGGERLDGDIGRRVRTFFHVGYVDGHGDGVVNRGVVAARGVLPVGNVHGDAVRSLGFVVGDVPRFHPNLTGSDDDVELASIRAGQRVGQRVAVAVRGPYDRAHVASRRGVFGDGARGGRAVVEGRRSVGGGGRRSPFARSRPVAVRHVRGVRVVVAFVVYRHHLHLVGRA